MNKVRPLSLTIIAWLFIIAGALSAWGMFWQLWQHRLSLSFGILNFVIGRGLLKFNPTAYSWAIFVVFLCWLSLAFIVVCSFFTSGAVQFGQQALTGMPRLLVLIGVFGIYGVILTWVTRVLMKREVEELFLNQAG